MKHNVMKNNSLIAALLIGDAIALLVTIGGAALLAWLIATERVGQHAVDNGALLILLVAGAIAAAVSSSITTEKRILICALSGVVYFLLLLAMTALFFGGQYKAVAVSGVVILGASVGVFLLRLRPGKRRNISRRKIKIR